jgi:hypothetical protein
MQVTGLPETFTYYIPNPDSYILTPFLEATYRITLYAISRSRAVPLKTGHKLRKERQNDSAEYPSRGYKLRAAEGGPSDWLPFLSAYDTADGMGEE